MADQQKQIVLCFEPAQHSNGAFAVVCERPQDLDEKYLWVKFRETAPGGPYPKKFTLIVLTLKGKEADLMLEEALVSHAPRINAVIRISYCDARRKTLELRQQIVDERLEGLGVELEDALDR